MKSVLSTSFIKTRTNKREQAFLEVMRDLVLSLGGELQSDAPVDEPINNQLKPDTEDTPSP